MGKETKIGLTVVGILLLVFGALLYRRLTTHDGSSTPTLEAVASQAKSSPLAKAIAPPVDPDHARTRSEGVIQAGWATPHSRAAHEVQASESTASDIPAEDVAVETPPLDRYAQSAEGLAADQGPSRSTRANPFRKPLQVASDEVEDAEPSRLVAVPPKPRQLEDAQQEEPVATTRSPIRRLGGQLPLDEPTAEPAASDDRYGSNVQEPQNANAEPRAVFDREPIADDAESSTDTDAIAPAVRSQFSSPAVEERPLSASTEPAPPEDGKYIVQPNDTLWAVSEKVYGNGRYFKAIAQHNRSQLPRPDRLTVGTVISVPPVSVLEQNYPALCPKQRKSALVKSRTMPASTRQRLSGDSYVVEEGDTLFDIARHELGKASRWAEIYDLNRETLGEDFDYLQPGTELVMPPKPATDAITRQRGTGVQR
jgi:nucleoid-associated protein YgaU